LDGGKTYHYRLHASNANGSVSSEDVPFPTLPTGRILALSAGEVTSSSALLGASVNPEGLAAHYHFEYGPCPSAAECPGAPYTATVPTPDASVAAGTEPVALSQRISGLVAGTTYHFRVALSNLNGTATPSPEGTFVYDPASPPCEDARLAGTSLPDCRAYEMVTPPEKDAALIDNGGFLTGPSIAEDGSRVISKSIQCFDSAASCVGIRGAEGEPFSFSRTESGWVTEPLAPAASPANTALRYSADEKTVLYTLAATPPGLEQFYVREPDGTFQAIGPLADAAVVGGAPPEVQAIAFPVAVSSDLSHIAYEGGESSFWPQLEEGLHGGTVFEYVGRGQDKPLLAGVTGPAGSTSSISACGTEIGSPARGSNVMSADGRTLYLTVKKCAAGTGVNDQTEVPAIQVYARIEGAHEMKSVLVSGPGPESVCDSGCRAQPAGDAKFEGASTDGSHVVFTSTQQLTNDASEDNHTGDSAASAGCIATGPAVSGCNLYEFACPNHCESPAEKRLTALSAGDLSGRGPQVQGVMAIAPDGGDVYFVARGVLTATANEAGRQPVAGGENLYVYRPGSATHVAFIGTLAQSDRGEWASGVAQGPQSTPDGRFLAFTSHAALTPDASGATGHAQVYRYDVQSEALERVSVGEQGFDDDGNAGAGDARLSAKTTMSADGSLIFFQSPVGLTPRALNDRPVTGNPAVLAQNIYEWEAQGAKPAPDAPACTEPGGCIGLISDGRDLAEGSGAHQNFSAVELLGIDATGANVFFWSADQLVGSDTDSQVDLYDARINGGFPEPGPPPACAAGETIEGEVCRSPFAPPPVFGAPGSSLLTGIENILPPAIKPSTKPPTPAKPPTAAQIRAAKLERALERCKTFKKHIRRKACEKRARGSYGAKAGARKSGHEPRRKP
jgi:hypothetical protein